MRSPWSKWLVVLTLTLSLGAHWALLQSVAWVGMIAAYSRDGSITQALSKTFDGRHPCRLCKMIQQGRAEEKKHSQRQLKPESKLDVGIVWRTVAFEFHRPPQPVAAGDFHAVSRHERPPKPPPRNIAANSFA
jgi:hypothetical protein